MENTLEIIFQSNLLNNNMNIFILITSMFCLMSTQEKKEIKQVSKNNMEVKWYYKSERIYFEMNAPTTGWVTIGFNSSSNIKNSYLLMGRVKNGKSEVVEHYTFSPGNYKSFKSLNELSNIKHVEGAEKNNQTTLKFSLPITATSKYQKTLTQNSKYELIMAFSQQDDFQHHSIMRTSLNINL